MIVRKNVVAGTTLVVSLSLLVTSCLFVKAPEQKQEINDVALSPQPEIPMSEELVRTPAGDMIALLPEGWLYIDAKQETSDDIIAIAVNPEYTLSAVFSSIPPSASTKESFDNEGLLGLARVAFNRHSRKSAGAVTLLGTYTKAKLGVREFGLYSFTTTEGSLRNRCAVYRSTLDRFYEFALVPMRVTALDVPSAADQEQIFNSILATIQY